MADSNSPLYNNPFALRGAARPSVMPAASAAAPAIAPSVAPSTPAPSIAPSPTSAPPDASTSGPGPGSQWQPSDYKQVQQAQLPKTGFGGLLQRALPIVQAIGGGLAAAYGNPLPAEMVLQQRQQQWANERQQGIDQQASQERDLRIQTLHASLQRMNEENKVNPPQSPDELMRTWAQKEAILAQITNASRAPSTLTDAQGRVFAWQPQPGTHAVPVAGEEGLNLQVPNAGWSPVMVKQTQAPELWNQMPGQPANAQGPVSPQEQTDFLKNAPEVQMTALPKGALTPEDFLKASIAESGQANTNAYRQAMLGIEQQRLAQGADKSDVARLDRSFTYNMNSLDKAATPVEQMNQRMGRLFQTFDQHNIQADALIAPELLSVMAGGQGSGLRMNDAEISRIVGGRTHWEELQAAANKWKTDPNSARSITPTQDAQLRSLARVVKNRLDQKLQVIDSARDQLIATDDVTEHRKILSRTKMMLDSLDAGKPISNANPASSTKVFNYDAQGNLIKPQKAQ